MNDLQILHDAWPESDPPADAVRAEARTALLERSSRAGRSRGRAVRSPGLGVRLAVVGALATAVAVGVTVVQTAGGTDERGRPRPVVPGIPAGPVANASEALERADRAAESRAFTPPRPDQWIYVESRVRTGSEPNGPVSGKDRVTRTWQRADGEKTAFVENGKLAIMGTMPTTPPSDYASLAALPTDPDALLKRMYTGMGGLGETREGRYSTAYQMLGSILAHGVLPPETEAAVFRAIRKIPGVTLVRGRVDADGRPALGLGRVADGYLHEELLLDPGSYAYLGERSVVREDHTSRGQDGVRRVRKGDLMNLTVRLRAGIVDRAGQRP